MERQPCVWLFSKGCRSPLTQLTRFLFQSMLLTHRDDDDFPVTVKFSQTVLLLSVSMGGSLVLIFPFPLTVLGGKATHNRDPLIMSF